MKVSVLFLTSPSSPSSIYVLIKSTAVAGMAEKVVVFASPVEKEEKGIKSSEAGVVCASITFT